jgi:hypothetical protein
MVRFDGSIPIFGGVPLKMSVTEAVWGLLDALGSEMLMVSVYVFGVSCVGCETFIETLIESEFPAVREPEGFDKVSQVAFFEADQLRVASPVFLMVKVWGDGFDPSEVLKVNC